jgi:hypothetical protein
MYEAFDWFCITHKLCVNSLFYTIFGLNIIHKNCIKLDCVENSTKKSIVCTVHGPERSQHKTSL